MGAKKLVVIRPGSPKATIFRKFMYKGKNYVLIGYGAIDAKSKKIQKDKNGGYVIFDGKKVRL